MRVRIYGAILFVSLSTQAATAEITLDGNGEPQVIKASARLQGVREAESYAFKGIRYALAPDGNRRFSAPVPAFSWRDGTLAKEYGAICPQIEDRLQGKGMVFGNEDCLFLNVWASSSRTQGKPVFVWFHGGGFTGGSGRGDNPNGTDELYSGRFLAADHDAVIVTANYRLGHLGFLTHPSLRDRNGDSGNYGLLDQQLVLEWVKRNIAFFGGDPRNVTIAGQSAGGQSILSHLISPLSAGLFHRAIVQSPATHFRSAKEAEVIGTKVVERLGCHSAQTVPECLRALPIETLVRSQRWWQNGTDAEVVPKLESGPNVGSSVLPFTVSEALRRGTAAKVSLIIGNNGLEIPASAFGVSGLEPEQRSLSAAQYFSYLEQQYGSLYALRVYREYPLAAGEVHADNAIAKLRSDFMFQCPVEHLARSFARQQPQPVRRYTFDKSLVSHLIEPLHTLCGFVTSEVCKSTEGFALQAFHGMELPYTFGLLAHARAESLEQQVALLRDSVTSAKISRLWFDFVANTPLFATQWAPYGLRDEPYLRVDIDGTFTVKPSEKAGGCQLWRELGYAN